MNRRTPKMKRIPIPKAKFKGSGTHPAGNPQLQFTKSGAFVPSRARTSLRWGFDFTASPQTSGTELGPFSGNSVFDPGQALSSTQPVGFDEYALLYDYYRVIGSKIEVQAMVITTNVLASRTASGSISVYANESGATLSTFSDMISQPYQKRADITVANVAKLVNTMKTSQVTGIKDMEGSDRCASAVSTNPSAHWYWHVGYVMDASYTDCAINFTVTITYDVEFFGRFYAPRSTLAGYYMQKAVQARLIEQRQASSALSDQKRLEDKRNDDKLHKLIEPPVELKESVSGFKKTPVKVENKTCADKRLGKSEDVPAVTSEAPTGNSPGGTVDLTQSQVWTLLRSVTPKKN